MMLTLHSWHTSTFDTHRWAGLQQSVATCLRCEPHELGVLHKIEAARGNRPRKSRRRMTGRNADPELLKALCITYHEFVCQHIAPQIAEAFTSTGSQATAIAFQANPSLRVNTPAARPAGRRHRDRDYGHQPAQVNYWLPLSPAFGSNTLHVEGICAAGGPEVATPLEGGFGTLHRFNGNELYHFTRPNDSDCTRVSLDFRVAPGQVYDNDHPASRSSTNGRQAFFVGGYYAWAELGEDGGWTVRDDGAGVVRGNAALKLAPQ
jgi:hypothetical protein